MRGLRKHAPKRRLGFTLVELMVAVAILGVLMSGIVVLFTGSMRAIRQTHQNMEAFEIARGAIATLERDLTTCFTSREFGDYYQFYGCPIGMSFVGVVGRDQGQNLGRVTYVMHSFVEGDATWGKTFETTMSDPADVTNELDVEVRTRSLIRFLEPGVRDLDTYPYPWPDKQPDWWRSGNAPAEQGSPTYKVWQELREVVMPRSGGGAEQSLLTGDREAQALAETLVAARKRELWIRMLSAEPGLPDIWGPNYLHKDPADYVLAENIAWRVVNLRTGDLVEWTGNNLQGAGVDRWFEYGRTALRLNGEKYDLLQDQASYFNGVENVRGLDILGNSAVAPDMTGFWSARQGQTLWVGDPTQPRLPEYVDIKFSLRLRSPYPGAPDFNRPFTILIDVPSGFIRSTPPKLSS